jgi:hypothetical protein
MAAPTTYTETELAAFMLAELGNVAASLGWSVQTNVQPAIDEALLVYGVDSIAEVSGRENIRKLRSFARVEAWRLAVNSLAADYDFKADGGDYKRSQLHDQAGKALERAQTDAAEFDVSMNVIARDSVAHVHDPYAALDDSEAVLP